MSYSCNFINWSSASNRRPDTTKKPTSLDQTLKKSDFDDATLRKQSDWTKITSETSKDSGNVHSCDTSESTQSTGAKCHDELELSSASIRGCEWRSISEEDYPELDYPEPLPDMGLEMINDNLSSSISLDDILDVEMNRLRLEEECRDLEVQAQYWEEKVEELERKQYAEDVPETLIENIIQHRKELRHLGLQLYEQNLELECLSCGEMPMSEHSFQDDHFELMDSDCLDLQMYFMNNTNNSSHCPDD